MLVSLRAAVSGGVDLLTFDELAKEEEGEEPVVVAESGPSDACSTDSDLLCSSVDGSFLGCSAVGSSELCLSVGGSELFICIDCSGLGSFVGISKLFSSLGGDELCANPVSILGSTLGSEMSGSLYC